MVIFGELLMGADRFASGLSLGFLEAELPVYVPEEERDAVVGGLKRLQDTCLCPLCSGDNSLGSVFSTSATVAGDSTFCFANLLMKVECCK